MKRIVITGAVHQKIKIAQVARDLGVSRSWASREASHPETQCFIAAIEKQDPETAVCSLDRALKAIAEPTIAEGWDIRAGKMIVGGYDDGTLVEFLRLRRILQKYY